MLGLGIGISGWLSVVSHPHTSRGLLCSSGVRISAVLFFEDLLLEVFGQFEDALEVGGFVKSQVVIFEEGTVYVAAEVAVESGEDGFAHAAPAVRVDVAQSPGDAASVAVVGKSVGHKGTGCDGGHLEQGFHFEMDAIRRVLHGVFFWSIQADECGDAFFVGPEAGFMAGVEDGV